MTVEISVHSPGGASRVVEMSGVTTVHYAAKRAAEAFGLDPELYWGFVFNGTTIQDEEIIADWGDVPLMLTLKRG